METEVVTGTEDAMRIAIGVEVVMRIVTGVEVDVTPGNGVVTGIAIVAAKDAALGVAIETDMKGLVALKDVGEKRWATVITTPAGQAVTNEIMTGPVHQRPDTTEVTPKKLIAGTKIRSLRTKSRGLCPTLNRIQRQKTSKGWKLCPSFSARRRRGGQT